MSQELLKRIDELEEQVGFLKEAIQYLSFSKVEDTRFAFFDWLVKNSVFGNRRARLDCVLVILGDRLDAEPLRKKVPIEGISTDLLYRDGVPTSAEAKTLLMQALQVEAETVVDELVDAFRTQGSHQQLVALWQTAPPSPQGSIL